MMDDDGYEDTYDCMTILEPTERDVLCGRGGMSNHHQGNEWYRRLIRSNRPLYRACPKHTKLLVSKAIVQAVEEQGGRFLERSRKTGAWYQVPYKRAVDKTSQGLRERDKDEPIGPNITTLPASLRAPTGGKIAKPNLKALAHVTMAHAGMPIPSDRIKVKPPPPPLPKMQQQQQQMQLQRQQQQQMQMQQQQQQQQRQQQRGSFFGMMGMGPPTPSPSGGGIVEPLDSPPQPGLLASQSSMFRILSRFGGGGGDNRRQSFANNDGASSFMGGGGGGNNNTRSSFIGPGLTSFMSWGASSGGSGGGMMNSSNNMNMNNNMNNMGMNGGGMNMGMGIAGGGGMNTMDMNDMNAMNAMNSMNNAMGGNSSSNNNMGGMNEMNMNNINMPNNGMNMPNNGMNMNMINSNNSMNNFPVNHQQYQQQLEMQQQQIAQQQQRQQQQQDQPVNAPALTRLTTQVSDWLTSFWPVGKGEDRKTRRTSQGNNNAFFGRGGAMMNQMPPGTMMNQMPPQGGNFGGNSQLVDDSNTMMAPMNRPSSAASRGSRSSSMINHNTSNIKSEMGMPAQLSPARLNSGGIGGDDSDDDIDIPQPATLESSVSTTLLKLASSPSKILAGISTFFSSEPSGFQDQRRQSQRQQPPPPRNDSPSPFDDDPLLDDPIPPPPPGGLGVPVGRRSSRRSSDLLDDYEETELEARMRAVAGN